MRVQDASGEPPPSSSAFAPLAQRLPRYWLGAGDALATDPDVQKENLEAEANRATTSGNSGGSHT